MGGDWRFTMPEDTNLLITELRSFVASEFQRIYLKLQKLENTTMATWEEFISEESKQTLAIADISNTLAANTAVILAVVEKLKNNVNPTQAEIDAAYEATMNQTAQLVAIKDSALALNPVVETPPTPTEPGEPLPPVELPAPTDPGDIDITPVPGIGLPGTSSFQARRK